MPSTALTALQKASAGLLYPSDADEPFEAFSWGKANGSLTPAIARKLAGIGPKEAIQQMALDDFFKNLISDDNDDADKYKALLKVVNEQLSGVKVFRSGDVELTIYLVGKTKEGEWAGLKTKSVET
jgi:Nuclease A inhibitor-like protein